MHLNIPIIFFCGREKKFAAFYQCHYINNFSPWEDIVRKKVLKLRSIAELRAFDGISKSKNLFLCLYYLIPSENFLKYKIEVS